MIAASELLQNIYINSGKYCRIIYIYTHTHIYIYAKYIYTHTIFLMSSDIFYLYTFFDVIVFNMLNKYIFVLCLLCAFFHMASLMRLQLNSTLTE